MDNVKHYIATVDNEKHYSILRQLIMRSTILRQLIMRSTILRQLHFEILRWIHCTKACFFNNEPVHPNFSLIKLQKWQVEILVVLEMGYNGYHKCVTGFVFYSFFKSFFWITVVFYVTEQLYSTCLNSAYNWRFTYLELLVSLYIRYFSTY